MANVDGGGWVTLGAGGIGALLGVVGTIVAAFINRQPSLAALVDARIRVLIESYEKRIGDLQREIERLEAKVDALTRALAEARSLRHFDV